MAPLRVSTTKSEWLPDDPTAFVPTRLWKLPFITTWDDSRNQNHPTDSAEEANLVKARVQTHTLADDGNQHVNRDRDPDLGLHGVLGGAEESFDPQMLLDPFEQLNDILPINNALLKSRSITATIRCVHRTSQWSGCTTFTTRSTMSCGAPMARRWRCRPG